MRDQAFMGGAQLGELYDEEGGVVYPGSEAEVFADRVGSGYDSMRGQGFPTPYLPP